MGHPALSGRDPSHHILVEGDLAMSQSTVDVVCQMFFDNDLNR